MATYYEIRAIQQICNEELISRGGTGLAYLTVDGIWGAKTSNALQKLQGFWDIPPSGIIDNATLTRLEPHMSRFLTKKSMVDAMNNIGWEERFMRAILTVEGRGSGFTPEGYLTILYERHVFYKNIVSSSGVAKANSVANQFGDICSPKGYRVPSDREPVVPDTHRYGPSSWSRRRLKQAISTGYVQEAYGAISMGLFQILGQWYKLCQTSSPKEMFDQQNATEINQLKHLEHFICSPENKKLREAGCIKDWTSFARLYNGVNYAATKYDVKLHNAYMSLNNV